MSRPRERSSNINAKRRCYIELEFISYHSRYDITSFILLFLTFILSIKNGKMKKSTLLFMFLFIYTQFFIFAINGTTPFYRTFSGMVWAGGLLLLILSRNILLVQLLMRKLQMKINQL